MTEQRRRVLGNRYELESVLGQGGMAKVFRATDQILNRTVAVKVLAPQFAGDEQFVTRFRREAQAAAALNHPNIVSVYDTGSQGDVHYIVMEYVEGRTLRDVIRQEGPVLPQRAVEIAEAVARGLAAAHEAGMVHRDIKPGNIMVTREGEVKVMDFGIARTSTADTLTQTAAVLGTASYLSPEQAQGEPVDARSDIYSVGCVLYEMVTGSPPFAGDSPVSIAYKHVRENPAPPTQLNADIPASLEAVILKCLAKNPANRYQDAEGLRGDLNRVSQGMPVLATPVMADSTQVLTGVPTAADGTAIMTGLPPDEEPDRRRTWLIVLGVVLALAAIGVAAFLLVRSLLPPENTLTVPNVIGETEEDATARLEEQGFVVLVETEFNPDEPRGTVFEQDPEGGALLDEGETVTIIVSRGEQPVPVPSVVGRSLDEAETILADADLSVGDVRAEDSEEPVGTVLEQDPGPGERIRAGGSVNLVVSGGPATITVPNVVCDDVDEAQAEINDAGLDFALVGTTFSAQCAEGTVASQEPGAGEQAEMGETVSVLESEGPEPTPTPTTSPS